MLRIVKFGDREGIGAVVQEEGWFRTKTWTANDDNKIFGKWVCRETGEIKYKGAYCYLDHFYKAQFDTKN